MPALSTARDHFQPGLARSQGFFPVPSPPRGALCWLAVYRDFGEVEAHDTVVGGEGFGLDEVEDAGLDPFVAAGSQGGVGHRPV